MKQHHLWSDAREILCRQTPGEHHPCAKVWNCLATTVEGWCTVDEKKQQVEMSGVLFVGVSHRQCISMNWECVCVFIT